MRKPDDIDPGLFVQVINLERSPDRLKRISENLNTLNIPFTRLPAIDGRGRDNKSFGNEYDLNKWVRGHHRNPIATELGCYASHVAAIDAFLAQDKPFTLILEDDAVLHKDTAIILQKTLRDAEHWDVLKLYAGHMRPLVRRIGYGDVYLCSFITRHAGAVAYLLNKKSAQKIRNHLFPATRPYDWVYDQGHKLKLKIRILSPLLISLASTQSTIEIARKSRKTENWLRRHTDLESLLRWKLPFSRFANEVYRIYYNVFVDGGLLALLQGYRKDIEPNNE